MENKEQLASELGCELAPGCVSGDALVLGALLRRP